MKLIINADDYGWDSDATQAILSLIRANKLLSTTIMANLASDDDLQAIVSFTQTVSTGIHVTLNEGKPVSQTSTIPSLVNQKGFFYSSSQLWSNYLKGRIQKEHIERELNAQLNKLKDFGIIVSHADSHQHLHQYPFLGKVILEVLSKAGINNVRRSLPEVSTDFRRLVLTGFHFLSQNNLSQFSCPDVLVTSFAHQKQANLELFQEQILALNKRGVQCAEFMCHPGLSNRPDSYLNRKGEYNFLLDADWIKVLENEKVELINYERL